MSRWTGWLRGALYRLVMRVAHRFNWHYAPPIYPEGDTLLWCQWCGFRAVVKRGAERRNEGQASKESGNG